MFLLYIFLYNIFYVSTLSANITNKLHILILIFLADYVSSWSKVRYSGRCLFFTWGYIILEWLGPSSHIRNKSAVKRGFGSKGKMWGRSDCVPFSSCMFTPSFSVPGMVSCSRLRLKKYVLNWLNRYSINSYRMKDWMNTGINLSFCVDPTLEMNILLHEKWKKIDTRTAYRKDFTRARMAS